MTESPWGRQLATAPANPVVADEPAQITGAQSLVQRARARRCRGHLRHPRRRDPAGLRPAVRFVDPAHPRPARAGRRSRGPGLRDGHRTRRRLHGHVRAPAQRTWSPPSPTPTWTRFRSSRSPARCRARAIGTDAFQEADIRGITMPITKHSYLVTNPDEIPRVIAEAFHIASTGRPGPVLVDIAKDAMQKMTTFKWPHELALPGYRPTTRPHGKQVREAAKLIAEAKRPVLYVGGGVIKADAASELAALVAQTRIPVVTTLMARGAFPDSHELHLGMPGMHGSVGRRRRAAEVRPAHHTGRAVRRPRHRATCRRSRRRPRRRSSSRCPASGRPSWPKLLSSRRSPTRPPRAARSLSSPRRTASRAQPSPPRSRVHRVHRPDPHERRRLRRRAPPEGRGRRDPRLGRAGGRPGAGGAAGRARPDRARGRNAARGCPRLAGARRHRASPTSSRRACASASTSFAQWASAR